MSRISDLTWSAAAAGCRTAQGLVPSGSGDGPRAALFVRAERPGRRIIAWLHGGGWAEGSARDDIAFCSAVAAGTHAVVAAVDYPLSAVAPYPAALDDCVRFVRWCAQATPDGWQLFVAGSSAGANLAAATALRLRDEGFHAVDGQVLLCSALYGMRTAEFPSGREYANGFGNDEDIRRRYWLTYVRSVEEPYNAFTAPLCAHDLTGLPPAIIVAAGTDPLRDEAREYARRLTDAGVSTTFVVGEGERHGFVVRNTTPGATAALDAICSFVSSRAGAP